MRSREIVLTAVGVLSLLSIIMFWWNTRTSKASNQRLEVLVLSLRADKDSLQTRLSSMTREKERIEDDEKKLQEELNVALGKLEESSNRLWHCENKVETVRNELTDSKELIALWNVTLRECQTKLRKCPL